VKLESRVHLPAEQIGSHPESPLTPAEAPEPVKRVLDAVGIASCVMHDLVAYSQNISDVSESGIIHYRELATKALAHVEALELERNELRAEIDRSQKAFEAKITDLEALVLAQRKELDKLRLLVWPVRRR
jgi:hypothetical protein